ncbi:diguanylate cyclase/phosphodiesterase with GAF sensor [Methylocella silvestris BL2]|uniref:Diguanylate cyclase/phosphodiesterase with GAF sensor n=1 Tax=Methylocella silvestris (strain DSM 15510 / CIP 108128 / LMG 27833 / NCIMB 13906 / BL2) TaxID=395965 RepID=B8ERS4_METSB|nr:EAL domain-containing protein [Methylocella silvestris]ACK51622.1 diguanylate cyclase/phosphodiesterase with GAF sensor [Methylocella silvestris BL2]
MEQSRASDPAALEMEALREQVRILYRTPAILAINAVAALLCAFILQPIFPAWVLAAWVGLFCIVISARIFDRWRYKHELQSVEAAGGWGRRFVFGAAATGCLWALAGSVILLTPDPAYHAFIALMLAGVMAGAVISNSAYLPALVAFVAPAVLPVILAFLIRSDPTSISAALLLAAFAALVGIAGLNVNRWIASRVRRKIARESWTVDVEKEIAERKLAESELRRANQSLKIVAAGATELLRSLDFDRSVPKLLELAGRSMGVSRVQLYERDSATDASLLRPARYGWSAPGIPPMLEAQIASRPAAIKVSSLSLASLSEGETEAIITREADEPARRLLDSRGVLSFLVAPVFVEGKCWGALGVDDCSAERAWSAVDSDALRALAELIAAAITRAQTLEATTDAAGMAKTEMTRLAYTDLLTGLPNRAAFLQELSEVFAAAKRGANPFAFLYLDLDRFKDINATLGHSIGDALLKAVAARLSGGLREGDLFARIGGDKFAVVLTNLADPAEVANYATSICGLTAAPFDIGAAEIHITTSIGVSIYRSVMTKAEDLMREADVAVYEAKDVGRNQCRFYSEALDLAMRDRVSVIEDLHAAIERGELELYYQPQVELPSGVITGVEALLRWNHPTRGLLGPGLFIPLAEKMGLITPIGRWVLTEVCRQLRIWRAEGINPPIMAVNLSAAQLAVEFDFEQHLAQALAVGGFDPTTIELELTETVLMQTVQAQVSAIDRLRALGVRIAIDDFGTGYSSLEYLRDYRVDRIKIAREFVSRLPSDPRSATIVRATIGLARELGIEVIAEGVETAGQAEFLMASRCRRIQGYYFGRPAPAAQAAEMLRRGALAPAAESGEPTPSTDKADEERPAPRQ